MSAWWFSENQNKSTSKPSRDKFQEITSKHITVKVHKTKGKKIKIKAGRREQQCSMCPVRNSGYEDIDSWKENG